MKSQTSNLIVLILLICLLIASCSSLKKSEIQIEAENQAKQWFDNSISKCEDNFVTKYDGLDIGVANNPIYMKKAYFQFKELSYVVAEKPVSEADKLNGVEWQGLLALSPSEPTLRYYDAKSYSNNPKWSEWQKTLVFYTHSFKTQENKAKDVPNTPFVMLFKKVKGKWEGLSDELIKPQCSDVPKG